MNFEGLTITIGCPGSGKSTWADANLPAETLRLERDRFREALFGSRRAYHDSPISREDRSEVITQAMFAAMREWPFHSWAVTDTGLHYHAVQPFIMAAEAMEQPIQLVVFERSPAFLRTNNRIRLAAHRIPDDILEERIELFASPEAWWRTDDYGYPVVSIPVDAI